jgi:DNA-directed RNA polymerase subunit beta'
MPIKAPNGFTVTLEDLEIKEPVGLDDIGKQLEMKYSSKGSLEGWLRGRIVIRNAKDKVVSKGSINNLIPIPFLTERGTFLINGSEKQILSQMRLKPGAYTTKNTDKNEVKTQLMFAKGIKSGQFMPQINMFFRPATEEFKIVVSSRPKVEFNGINFLRQLGFQDGEIRNMIGNATVSDTLFQKYGNKNAKSVNDIYKAVTGKNASVSPDKARLDLFDFFKDNALFQTGSAVVQSNLGLNGKDSSYLSKPIITMAVKKTFSVSANETQPDPKDDIKYKDIFNDTDLIMEQVEKDIDTFVEKSKEKLESEDGFKADAFSPILKLGDSVKTFMSESSLIQTPEETNPLFVAAMNKKITQLGDGGLSSDAARNEFGARNLTISGVNKVDPIETPESGNVGFVQHLTQSAEIKNKTIYIPVYKVKNGVAEISDKNKVELSTLEDHDARVAFYDTKYVKRDGNKLVFIANEVPGRYMGKMTNLPVNEVEFIDTAPQNVLGLTANMIPFVMHNDGVRALMGTNMQKQAIPLKHREAPLVTTLADHNTGATYDEIIGREHGKPVYSEVDGTVDQITDSTIVVKDAEGKKYKYSFYHYYPLNQSFANNELKVRVGDVVKKGQMLAEGWHTKDGKLALGKNARLGYVPYKGYNYEDGVVISKSFAQDMATEETDEVEIEIPKDFLGGRGSSLQTELTTYTSNPEVKQRLDKDGIIKNGEYVKPGSTLVAALRPLKTTGRNASLSDIIRASDKNIKYEYKPFKIEQTSYVEGKVVRVNVVDNPDGVNKQKIILTLVTSKPLKLGDKISGRHGNKGTITKILPDHLMPTTEDGKPLDLMFSPLAVPSRKNLGQVFEVNAGLIAEKTGNRFVVDNFNHNEKDRVLQGLKDIGIPDGKMKVFLKEEQADGNVKDIAIENPITVGNMYIMKLKHKVDDKIQSRSNLETAPGIKDNMPSKQVGRNKGEKHNPQSYGEMEMRALQGHGAIWNALESTTIKADGGGDDARRIAMFKAMSTGHIDPADLDVPATPESMKLMADNLKALGLNVKPLNNGKEANSFHDVFDSLSIAPMKSSEFLKLVGEENEVRKHDLFNARDLYDSKKSKKKKDEDDQEDIITGLNGGLLDPKIFGMPDSQEQRTKWGYIKLATPMVNPVLMQDRQYNPYSIVTGIGSTKLQELMNGKKIMVLDPKEYKGFDNLSAEERKQQIATISESMKSAGLKAGDFVKPDELEKLMEQHGQMLWKAGGEGLQHLLDKVDLDKEIEKAKSQLDIAKGDQIDVQYKKYRTLISLKNNNLHPADLMMHYVPVTPAYLRPVSPDKQTGTMIIDDLNKLYANLIKTNNPARGSIENGFDLIRSLPPTEAARTTGNIYSKMLNLSQHVQGKDMKSKKDLKGFKSQLGGKEGLIRGKMLSKRVDFSGRSVIGVDPNLGLNEVGIPLDMAKDVYKPFIINELIHQGRAANEFEAAKKWKNFANDSDVKKVINDIAADRPIIINRQPSLHKFSIQAFKPVIKETQDGMTVRSIHLNPLVVTGFNADFDGDTMAIHVPITEKAKEEAKGLMMPSSNLINPTNGQMIIEIRHEMALGIYYLTVQYDKPQGQAKAFNTYTELERAYFGGAIGARQKVNIGKYQGITAGMALFNLLLPENYRNFKQVWGSKQINSMIAQMYRDGEKSGWKTLSVQELSLIIDRVKKLGFNAATRSGVSIGTGDFKQLEQANQIFNKHIDAAKKDHPDNPEMAQIVGWQKGEKEIEDLLGSGKILSDDNPLQVMMASGARAKKDQIRRMMVSVGVGMDVTKQLITPIKESHFDGLSPQDYFKIGFDSRKGISDRSVATRDPGALSREVWSATQDIIVKEEDCGTRDGVTVRKSDKTVRGRYAAKDIIDENGKVICKRNQMITDEIIKELDNDNSIKTIMVRSPLRCKTVHGVCRKCYGTLPGTLQPVKLGTAVGVLASQALGEPVTQMTMNTFHSGGANSSATLGLPRVKDILNLSADQGNGAVLAKVSGKITAITEEPFKTVVIINNTAHDVPNGVNGDKKPLRVKVGDTVVKGEFLTTGNVADLMDEIHKKDSEISLTNADPKTLFKLKREFYQNELQSNDADQLALKDTQDYLTNAMQYAFQKTVPDSLDRRHMETIVGKLTSKVRVVDAGGSKYLKGTILDRNEADAWNAQNPTLKPIEYENKLYSKNSVVTEGHDNWFSNLGHQNVYQQLARGATFGQVDKLNDPRSRLMSGKLLNLGEGHSIDKNIANNISSSMYNFFSGALDNISGENKQNTSTSGIFGKKKK